MPTLILDPPPVEVAALLERRRALGQDRHDEIWEGVYHLTPGPAEGHAYVDAQLVVMLASLARQAELFYVTAFNLGEPGDFRVPDGGVLTAEPADATYLPAAVMVVEVLSPGDETFEKFDFYAARGIGEILVVDPQGRTVRCLHRTGAGLDEQDRSDVLRVATAEITAQIRWPAAS